MHHVRSAFLIGYEAALRANHEPAFPLLSRRCSGDTKRGVAHVT